MTSTDWAVAGLIVAFAYHLAGTWGDRWGPMLLTLLAGVLVAALFLVGRAW